METVKAVLSFVFDNAGAIGAGAAVYAGGCYTPRTLNAIKARLSAWFAK